MPHPKRRGGRKACQNWNRYILRYSDVSVLDHSIACGTRFIYWTIATAKIQIRTNRVIPEIRRQFCNHILKFGKTNSSDISGKQIMKWKVDVLPFYDLNTEGTQWHFRMMSGSRSLYNKRMYLAASDSFSKNPQLRSSILVTVRKVAPAYV